MKLSVVLFTILTLHVCHIRVSALEEHDVEALKERDIEELDLELVKELEEDEPVTDIEDHLKARPSKFPYCVRTHRSGWGGKCLSWDHIVGANCDFIFNATHKENKEDVCYHNDEVCCVDCYAPKQRENCPKWIPHLADVTRRECCPGFLNFYTMGSGCKCCGKCHPDPRWCTKKGGFCVSKHDDTLSYKYCRDLGCKLYGKRCRGKNCACCICPQAK